MDRNSKDSKGAVSFQFAFDVTVSASLSRFTSKHILGEVEATSNEKGGYNNPGVRL